MYYVVICCSFTPSIVTNSLTFFFTSFSPVISLSILSPIIWFISLFLLWETDGQIAMAGQLISSDIYHSSTQRHSSSMRAVKWSINFGCASVGVTAMHACLPVFFDSLYYWLWKNVIRGQFVQLCVWICNYVEVWFFDRIEWIDLHCMMYAQLEVWHSFVCFLTGTTGWL